LSAPKTMVSGIEAKSLETFHAEGLISLHGGISRFEDELESLGASSGTRSALAGRSRLCSLLFFRISEGLTKYPRNPDRNFTPNFDKTSTVNRRSRRLPSKIRPSENTLSVPGSAKTEFGEVQCWVRTEIGRRLSVSPISGFICLRNGTWLTYPFRGIEIYCRTAVD
jgi:hypothetical protein